MADLQASDVAVILAQQDIDFTAMGKRLSYPTIKFGDGAKTIPAGGLIPLPAKENFGMKRAITRLIVCGTGGSGYIFEYVAASHSLLALMGNFDAEADGPLIPAAAVAIAETTLPLVVIGE
jgi:hypothetical protein